MRWPEDAEGWPHADRSRIVACRPHRWHVQEMGEGGPRILLIHGAGGATQSFRDLMPCLAREARCLAMDLPGQGFTRPGASGRYGLDAMSEDLARLLDHLDWQPDAVVAHSAGGAIALRLAELGQDCPIVTFNAALGRFEGVAGWLFPLMAKALALNPLSATLFAATATRASVRRLVEGTGSVLDERGLDLYYRLATDRQHVDGTLRMMAAWSVDDLLDRLGMITVPVTLVATTGDKAVPARQSRMAAEALPNGRYVEVEGPGHLYHETHPEDAARHVRDAL